MSIGFRILRRRRAVPSELVDRFRTLPVANVSDSMWRITAGGPRLRPYYGGATMAGPAFTVKTRPGDNLMVHKALDLASPGDIVVVDAGGDLTNAIIGEIMSAHAEKRGLGGIVINGSIRDSTTLAAGTFPVFAAGVTHRGPYKDGPGEINVPIAIDGMVIEPGDLIVGDGDGLLCVPFDQVESVLQATEKKFQAEQVQIANVKAGTSDRSWIDATLKRLNVEIEGESSK
ncbi:MAG: RraA family protein [Lautropia sp.]